MGLFFKSLLAEDLAFQQQKDANLDIFNIIKFLLLSIWF